LSDDQIGPLLAHRVLITSNVDRFQELAAVHEYSLIDIANCNHDAPSLAAEISKLWMKPGLKHKQGFVLRLTREGAPVLEDVE
jgi:hypothetical protein